MLLQCQEPIFGSILKIMKGHEPFIVKDDGMGYIDVFDKDWIFLYINETKYPEQTEEILNLILSSDEVFLLATANGRLIQQKVSETEQYIFLRKLEEGYKITNAWTTYLSF